MIASDTIKNSGIRITNDTFTSLVEAAGVKNRTPKELYTKFDRISCIDPFNSINTTKEFIFFTKPDLHIFQNGSPNSLNPELSKYPIFRDGLGRYNNVLQQLQSSCKECSSPFMNLLSNTVRSNMDLPDVNADDIVTSANILGTTMSYRKSSEPSDNSPDFTLEFEDTKNLEVYMLFKFYDIYSRLKSKGWITPPYDYYIQNKIIHDQFSAYKFIVGDDMETIIFYAKYWGVYPRGYPRSALSDIPTGTGLRFSIPFKAQWVDDMTPEILIEFNRLAESAGRGSYFPWYDDTINGTSGKWANMPYVVKKQSYNSPMTKYQLKWKV